MKCIVCGSEVEQGSKCEVCGFFAISFVGEMDSDQAKQMEDMAESWRKQFVGSAAVSVIAMEWEANEQEILVLAQEHELSCSRVADMELDKTYWLDTKFARLDGDTFDLHFRITDKNNNVKDVTIPMSIPKEKNFWYLGTSLHDGLKIQFHLRSGQDVTTSEMISIF